LKVKSGKHKEHPAYREMAREIPEMEQANGYSILDHSMQILKKPNGIRGFKV
jgi:hypothetical protein